MSSLLVLGNYNCEYNRVDKTNYINWDSTTHSIEVMENGTNEDTYNVMLDVPMDSVRDYNYCKIDGKEYFLAPVRAIDGGMCLVECTADVLHQNREKIYLSEQLVERNAKHKNSYMRDSMKTFASYDTVDCLKFSTGGVSDSIILITAG